MASEVCLHDLGIGDEIAFVENHDRLLALGIEFAEHGIHRLDLLCVTRVGEVHHMQEQVRQLDLLESRLEGFDERVRELADETHGVGEQNLLMVRQRELARGGIECFEKPIAGFDSRASEPIEEGGFAGVRVAHERDEWPVVAQAAFALDAPVFAHLGQFALEPGDAVLHAAAVDLELGFAGAACADAAGLSREVTPHAGEAGEEVLELGEFDLQTALAGAGSGGENVEDQLAAVDDLPVGDFFQISALRGR